MTDCLCNVGQPCSFPACASKGEPDRYEDAVRAANRLADVLAWASVNVETSNLEAATELSEAVAGVRALASPAAAPAAETVRCMCPPGTVAGSCPLRNDVQSICECRCHAPPSEPAAPAPDLRTVPVAALNRILAALRSPERLRANEHVIYEVRQYIAAPAQRAEARIAELERALREAQGQLCAEHCEWTGSGDHDDQCVKLSKALAARAAPPAKREGT